MMEKLRISKKLFISSLSIFVCALSSCGNSKNANYNVIEEEQKESGIDYKTKINDLIIDNSSSYKIIYPSKASEAIVEGAKEIRQMILDTSNVYLDIISDEGLTYNSSSCYISLGSTIALKKSNLDFNYLLLKHDGFFIYSDDKSVFIDGISDRGILYGAYEFCERVLGVKYLTSTETHCEQLSNVALYKMTITSNPAFDDRCYINRKFYNDYKYMTRMRAIHEYRNFGEMYGGDIGWFNDAAYLSNYVHNSLDYVKPSIYREAHPDWYFVDDDKVCDLHYCNVGLNEDGTIDESLLISPVKVAIETLKEFLLNSDETIKYYMLGQMDFNYTCQCNKCVEQEQKYGRSGMNIRFVNAIYDEVSKWSLEMGITKEWYLCTFAYQWSQSSPTKLVNKEYVALDSTVIPRDNVIVRLAPIQADNYYGMIDEKQNDRTRELFLGWKSILKGKKTMIWSYHSRFSFYFVYYPTMQHWKEDFKLYQEIGSQYIFMQPNCTEAHDWRVNMETYVASKMLWDPTLDANSLRDEFIKYYYKDIANLVSDYNLNFELQYAQIASREDAPDMTIQGKDEMLDTKYYSVPFWETQLDLLKQMYKKIESLGLNSSDYSAFKTKIDELKMTTEFMILYHYDEYYYDDYWGKQKMLDDFFDTYLSLQIVNWREVNGSINTLKSLLGYSK